MNYAIPERCRRRCACSPRSHRCLAGPGHPGGCTFIEVCKLQASRYDPTGIRRQQLLEVIRRADGPIYLRRILRQTRHWSSPTTLYRDLLALVRDGKVRVVHSALRVEGRTGGGPIALLEAV